MANEPSVSRVISELKALSRTKVSAPRGLDSWDPTVPAPGQAWQARGYGAHGGGPVGGGGGIVKRIHHMIQNIAMMNAEETYYVTSENLRCVWRCVDHLPEAALHVGGDVAAPFVGSWFEFFVSSEASARYDRRRICADMRRVRDGEETIEHVLSRWDIEEPE